MKRALIFFIFLLPACTSKQNENEPRWFKGNLHTHSLWSDGNDFPESICDWYRQQGYNFLAISDHNTLAEGEKWFKIEDLRKRGSITALNHYLKTYSKTVQTRGHRDDKTFEVRLTTFADYKKMTERPGKFIVIQGEEITDKFEKPPTGAATRPTTLPIHMNATNLTQLIKPQGGKTVREVLANNFKAMNEQSKRTGQPILPHINHPNFGYALTAEDIAAVTDEHFFEAYNGHPGVNHLGNKNHVSIERMWDIANTIRLVQLGAPPLMGLGTDDSHHYHEPKPSMSRSTSGRGWVMVRAKSLDANSLIEAMKKGDFYASSGVTLEDVSFDPASKTLSLKIKPDGSATFTTHFVGTSRDIAHGSQLDLASPRIGVIFTAVDGRTPSYTLTGKELYVRAVVTSSKAPVNPSFKDQKQQAWTQPVGWQAPEGRKAIAQGASPG